jgi:hypothetical protein
VGPLSSMGGEGEGQGEEVAAPVDDAGNLLP